MDTPDYLLSVTATSTSDTVAIHADKKALLFLRERLDALLSKLDENRPDHEHLRSPDWAGFELTTSMLDSEYEAGRHTVQHVEIYA